MRHGQRVEVWCRNCGSNRLDAQDRVIVMYEVQAWEWGHQERAVPYSYGTSDTVYDSAEPAVDALGNEVPYWCRNCMEDLERKDLVVTDPENENRLVEVDL